MGTTFSPPRVHGILTRRRHPRDLAGAFARCEPAVNLAAAGAADGVRTSRTRVPRGPVEPDGRELS